MNPDNIKIVAFDCDGVMFDTAEANRTYYNRILNHFNLPPLTDEQFTHTHMHTVDSSLDYILTDRGIREKADEVRKTLNYSSLIPFMKIEPGLITLLSKLRPRYKTAIATNRSDTMDQVIQEHGLEGCFDLVISARDVVRPKPFPDPLIKIMNHFSVFPEDILYIGDSELDEKASRAASIPFVAYNNPALSADIYINKLSEIEALLKL
ncbi:MAG: haloacid dehalogenase [Desulfobacterium sp.]|nr:haloacid dehalogenase [Desulfobacterium sp.]